MGKKDSKAEHFKRVASNLIIKNAQIRLKRKR